MYFDLFFLPDFVLFYCTVFLLRYSWLNESIKNKLWLISFLVNFRPISGYSRLFSGYSRTPCFDIIFQNLPELHILILLNCNSYLNSISCPNWQLGYFSARLQKRLLFQFNPKFLPDGGRRYIFKFYLYIFFKIIFIYIFNFIY